MSLVQLIESITETQTHNRNVVEAAFCEAAIQCVTSWICATYGDAPRVRASIAATMEMELLYEVVQEVSHPFKEISYHQLRQHQRWSDVNMGDTVTFPLEWEHGRRHKLNTIPATVLERLPCPCWLPALSTPLNETFSSLYLEHRPAAPFAENSLAWCLQDGQWLAARRGVSGQSTVTIKRTWIKRHVLAPHRHQLELGVEFIWTRLGIAHEHTIQQRDDTSNLSKGLSLEFDPTQTQQVDQLLNTFAAQLERDAETERAGWMYLGALCNWPFWLLNAAQKRPIHGGLFDWCATTIQTLVHARGAVECPCGDHTIHLEPKSIEIETETFSTRKKSWVTFQQVVFCGHEVTNVFVIGLSLGTLTTAMLNHPAPSTRDAEQFQRWLSATYDEIIEATRQHISMLDLDSLHFNDTIPYFWATLHDRFRPLRQIEHRLQHGAPSSLPVPHLTPETHPELAATVCLPTACEWENICARYTDNSPQPIGALRFGDHLMIFRDHLTARPWSSATIDLWSNEHAPFSVLMTDGHSPSNRWSIDADCFAIWRVLEWCVVMLEVLGDDTNVSFKHEGYNDDDEEIEVTTTVPLTAWLTFGQSPLQEHHVKDWRALNHIVSHTHDLSTVSVLGHGVPSDQAIFDHQRRQWRRFLVQSIHPGFEYPTM